HPTPLSLDDALALSSTGEVGGGGEKRVMLVVYVGGVSYLELAALRFLSADPSFPYRIIVATNKVISGNSLIKALMMK
ncbi:hypothetical protein EON64_00070, partial [archaeon]